MLYKVFLLPARLFFHLYCRRLSVNNREFFKVKGPLLLACNHPNSFLDAIILATLFRAPIYSLARGDAFKGKLVTKILKAFNMLPVYRVSEGVENLEHNYSTFDACQSLFQHNQIVLIFSEGRCINEWHLRPLKKGTARLALAAWHNDVPLKVLPVGLNYSNFRKFGKNVIINFGEFLKRDDFPELALDGKTIGQFNNKLLSQLQGLVIEIAKEDTSKRKEIFDAKTSLSKKIILCVPAALGFLLHKPLFEVFHRIIRKRAHDHYDSIFVGLLFFIYPVYTVGLAAVCWILVNFIAGLITLVIMPFLLWSFLQLKKIV